jgi:hypothetical protein
VILKAINRLDVIVIGFIYITRKQSDENFRIPKKKKEG